MCIRHHSKLRAGIRGTRHNPGVVTPREDGHRNREMELFDTGLRAASAGSGLGPALPLCDPDTWLSSCHGRLPLATKFRGVTRPDVSERNSSVLPALWFSLV